VSPDNDSVSAPLSSYMCDIVFCESLDNMILHAAVRGASTSSRVLEVRRVIACTQASSAATVVAVPGAA
jgi:hypothetical protein